MIAGASVATRSPHILLVTDKPEHCGDLVGILNRRGPVGVLPAVADGPVDADTALCAVIDMELAAPQHAGGLQLIRRLSLMSLPLVFVIDHEVEPRALGQALRTAREFGARNYLTRPIEEQAVLRILPRTYASALPLDVDERQAAEIGIAAAHAALTSVFEAARAGRGVAFDEIAVHERPILEALRVSGIKAWLETVRRHHSRTYSHSLLVTGVVVAFAQKLGMRPLDQRRLARAGLLHDVGKAFVPLAILDKPGPLTAGEMDEIKKHPVLGHEHLLRQGGFPAEILDCVRHHHELLDGSGYPDGLGGAEIADLIRITTIADIFSALIEERAYKPALPPERAFAIMERMGDKLDTDLLREFRPIAVGTLAPQSH